VVSLKAAGYRRITAGLPCDSYRTPQNYCRMYCRLWATT